MVGKEFIDSWSQTKTDVFGEGCSATMPSTRRNPMKKKMVRYGVGISALGLGVGAAAFVVGNMIVPGLGFAASGIVANSFAASMMSSAAIANGGGVAAGSPVAVLQSIGATGKTGVAAGTCAAAEAGAAAVGTAGVAAGETVYTVKNGKSYVSRSTQTEDQIGASV
ncbi:uncharacterized protein [Diadema antillarum]|uniref:uncharacterized protein n=1 Tax=Diadema antillarum TaxID=105358 RepID=UPI003A8A142B